MVLLTSTMLDELPVWQPATWEDYIIYRDDLNLERIRLFFNQGWLFVEDMGSEGINHARFSDLLVMLFAFWFARKSDRSFDSLGRCLLEKTGYQAASPDQVLYIGPNAPRWRKGEPRRINLDEWRVPDLVGEVSDTTLATDLDEKKRLYAALNIPEYWVVDVDGRKVLAFRLQPDGRYQLCSISGALEGLPIALLNQALEQLEHTDNGTVAVWFAQQIENI
jgi:Uma2 family endonuclease